MTPMALSDQRREPLSRTNSGLSEAQLDLQRLMQQAPPAVAAPSVARPAQVWVGSLHHERSPQGLLQIQDLAGLWRPVQRAHSCLVPPQPGDLVQLVQTDNHCWAVAVLLSADPEQGLVVDAQGQTLTLQAQNLHLRADDTLQQEADTHTSRSRLCTHTSQERQTRVHGTDSTRASNLLTHVQRHHSVHAGSATLTASSLLKVDAAQIHMG